jgi:hypothetical protein
LWVENMTTEGTQDPSVSRVFLREILFRFICVIAKIHFGTEDLDLLFFPFDSEVLEKIDEIDVLREDSLRCRGEIFAQAKKIKGGSK